MHTIQNRARYIPRDSPCVVSIIYFNERMILISGSVLKTALQKGGNVNKPVLKETTRAITFLSIPNFS